MASRKEQKEQARAARIAKEQATAANAQRTRRLQILGGAVAVAVIVVVVAIVVSSGGGAANTGTSLTPGPTATAASKSVDAELAGIPQNGTTLGKPSAKVTMIYFGDLQCPICKAFTWSGRRRPPRVHLNAGPPRQREGHLPLVLHRQLQQHLGENPRLSSTSSSRAPTPPARRASSGTTPSSSTTFRARRTRHT